MSPLATYRPPHAAEDSSLRERATKPPSLERGVENS